MVCKIKECGRVVVARGFCTRHYGQYWIGAISETGKQLRPMKKQPLRFQASTCRGADCLSPVRTMGFCDKHYQRFKKGTIDKTGAPTGEGKWWRKDRTKKNGYFLIKAPENHPNADRYGKILEHRLVMEKHIGRYLELKEVVHHLNGIKTDNRIENLQLRVSRRAHGHGHEPLLDVEAALLLLEAHLNTGMSGATQVQQRLQRLVARLAAGKTAEA